jgi:2,3-bisphosphoglycerate-independent phosphoglycerate mutase
LKNTTVLIVLDGFGYREATDGNAIAAADTPNWDRYWSAIPRSAT